MHFCRVHPASGMVSEIRDADAAREVLQFIDTGHQVWTTIHVHSANAILFRLLDMGVSPAEVCKPGNVVLLMKQTLLPRLPDWARSSSCLVSVLKESVRAVELTGCWRNLGVSRVVRRNVTRPADRGNGGAERVATAGASADGADREFRKIIAQGGHVTPSIEFNPLTACTRN